MNWGPVRGLASGTVLGHVYRIGRRIADGGMGTVYEAEHLRIGRRCAVKVLAPELAANREALARFRREVEITAQLSHPHVVQVFDVGTVETGEPYLVMEYLEGEDLAKRLQRSGRLPLPSVMHVARQVASALIATHARGIVHRDLKPGNVFLLAVEGSPDFVKVVDFGISKMPRSASKLTRASMLVGTPEYMAPEQASGRIDAIDHRTDQWALAAIIWEMIAGRPPFTAAEISALLFRIVHDPPAPLHTGMAGPALQAIEPVLQKALAKRRGDRFATVHAFIRALETAIATADVNATAEAPALPPSEQRESSWRRPTRWMALDPAMVIKTVPVQAAPRRRWRWVAAGAVSLVVGAALWSLYAPRRLPAAAVAPERQPKASEVAPAPAAEPDEPPKLPARRERNRR